MLFTSQLNHKHHLMEVSLHLLKVNIHHSHNTWCVNLHLNICVIGNKKLPVVSI